MDRNQVRQLKKLEKQYQQLKRLMADLTEDKKVYVKAANRLHQI
jgi:predicted  nucleic acid-binding Zn-ribbon protein